MIKSLKVFLSVNSAIITIGVILVSTALFLSGVPILEMIELKTYDLRFLSRGNLSPLPAAVLALIDEKSLDTDGRWPWPRSKIAHLVGILSRDGAKVVGFDVGFLEPDEVAPLVIDELLNAPAGRVGLSLRKQDEIKADERGHPHSGSC